jgi:hypothetical protein
VEDEPNIDHKKANGDHPGPKSRPAGDEDNSDEIDKTAKVKHTVEEG